MPRHHDEAEQLKCTIFQKGYIFLILKFLNFLSNSNFCREE
jgi:hypothetical protein